MDKDLNDIFSAKMTDAEFQKLSKFIYTEFGIKMPPVKKTMLQSRLQKRLRHLNIKTYKEYIDFVFGSKTNIEEIINMIDVVSTNKTDFFREPAHFDFLTNSILPEFAAQNRQYSHVKIWSAGCSTGEEPYTIGIVMNEFLSNNKAFDYSIYATDISTRVLKQGATAIYTEDKVDVIPLTLKKKYLLRSKDRTKKTVRINPAIRKKITFNRLNFIDATYDAPQNFDIIFCRNVLIYFDRETQEKVISKLCNHLRTGGYFFLGHSESIMNLNVPLKQVKPTIFKRL